jgi:hypothetical protein
MTADIQVLRAILTSHIWNWDPYGVSEDRIDIPDQYDDWIEGLVKVVLREPTAEAARGFLAARIAEDGLNPALIKEFDIDQLLSEISGR